MTKDVKNAVGALIICPSTNRALLNLRAPYKTHSLCWSLWGGMMEDGETPSVSLIREFKEEMGLIPQIEKLYPFDIYESSDKSFRYYTFICIVDNEFTPELNQESVGYAWTKIGIWPKPLHFGARKSLTSKKSLSKIKMIIEQHQ